MPRRNFLWLLSVALLSLLCYYRIPHNRYGRVLAEVMDHISQRYYEPVDDLKLFEGAMKGMREPLDENSLYYAAGKAKQEFNEGITRQFGGVGMVLEVDAKTKQLIARGPFPGDPAFKAGIRDGDKILKVDGQSTQGWSRTDATEHLRGKPGTPVIVTVLHAGESTPVEITIVRQIIHVDTVRGESRKPSDPEHWNFMLPGRDRIGYIRLTGFTEGEPGDESDKPRTTTGDLAAALAELTQEGMRGLVLDLRSNPGGSLQAAREICDLFISSGEIVTTRGRNGRIINAFHASGKAPYTKFPMAVLINQESASASEIVAACLQDNHRAVVVGQQTYGKGTVQEVIDLGKPLGTLKLTIASFWRPNGNNMHRPKEDAKNATWGVTPDEGCQVPVDDDELTRFQRWQLARELAGGAPAKVPSGDEVKEVPDRPLARAVEYLEKTLSQH